MCWHGLQLSWKPFWSPSEPVLGDIRACVVHTPVDGSIFSGVHHRKTLIRTSCVRGKCASPGVLTNKGFTLASVKNLDHANTRVVLLCPDEVRTANNRQWCTSVLTYRRFYTGTCIVQVVGPHVSSDVLVRLGSTIASTEAFVRVHVPRLDIIRYEACAAKQRLPCFGGLHTPQVLYQACNKYTSGGGPFGITGIQSSAQRSVLNHVCRSALCFVLLTIGGDGEHRMAPKCSAAYCLLRNCNLCG